MDVNFELIDKNLITCWEHYKDYRFEFRRNHYEEEIEDDFIDWCINNLYYCENCGNILVKDDECTRLYEPLNSDNVCDYCIEEGGYYD